MEYSFEYKDYIITIDIEAGLDYDDPAEWVIKSIGYVDGELCEFEQLPTAARQEIESACEGRASNKAYDAWCDRAASQADSWIDSYKERD